MGAYTVATNAPSCGMKRSNLKKKKRKNNHYVLGPVTAIPFKLILDY